MKQSTNSWLNQIETEKVKELLGIHFKKTNQTSADLDHFKLVESHHFDIVLYSLKTTVQSEVTKENYFDLNSNIILNLVSLNLNPNLQSNVELKSCYECDGNKYIKCQECNHHSLEVFSQCLDHDRNERCSNCSYFYAKLKLKEELCAFCDNDLFIRCETCKGYGQLNYLKCKTTVKKSMDDVVINCKDKSIPLKVILKSKGSVIVDQTMKKLSPVSSFPDREVYELCRDLLNKHDQKLKNSMDWSLVNQSHQLVAIPVTLYKAKTKSKRIKFYLVGENSDIYFPLNSNCCSIS